MITSSDLVNILKRIPAAEFNPTTVREALTGVTLMQSSVDKYVHWTQRAYTRNLVYRDDVFELLAVCWDSGTCSPIHNHSQQDCWMFIQHGSLCLEDFELADPARRGECGDDIIVRRSGKIPKAGIGTVDHRGRSNEIHRVVNCRSFQDRAISFHVYSRPFDECIVYRTKEKRAFMKRLAYDTREGLPA